MAGRRSLGISTIAALLLAFLPVSGSAWEVATHRELNARAATQITADTFLLDTYLREHLGLKDGLQQRVGELKKERTVLEWILMGGQREDDFPRYFNHFHDPLRTWDQAGLSVLGSRWNSSIVWAQMSAGSQFCWLPLGIPYPCDDYSFQDARVSYRQALTAPTNSERQRHFANTFRALGHVMHLVEDAAVPEHTRNDQGP